MPDLLQQLQDLAKHVEYPPTPDLRPALALRTAGLPPSRRGYGIGSRRMALALAAVVVVAVGLLVYTPSRVALARFFHLRGVVVRHSSHALPTPASSATSVVDRLQLGTPTSLEAGARAAGFHLAPPPPSLGTPDLVLLREEAYGTAISFLYYPRPDLPDPRRTGVGLLITQLNAPYDRQFLGKTIGGQTTISSVKVGQADGLWIAGSPHGIVVGPAQSFAEDALRLAEDTLLWESAAVTLRVESALSRDAAIKVGEQLH
jgi:hypothetical protein